MGAFRKFRFSGFCETSGIFPRLMLILPVEKRRLPIRGVGGLKDRYFSLSAARLPDICRPTSGRLCRFIRDRKAETGKRMLCRVPQAGRESPYCLARLLKLAEAACAGADSAHVDCRDFSRFSAGSAVKSRFRGFPKTHFLILRESLARKPLTVYSSWDGHQPSADRIDLFRYGSVAPQFACRGPVFFFDVMYDDIDSARVAFQGLACRFGNGFGQFAFLFDRTAFENLDIDCWHDVSLRVK